MGAVPGQRWLVRARKGKTVQGQYGQNNMGAEQATLRGWYGAWCGTGMFTGNMSPTDLIQCMHDLIL